MLGWTQRSEEKRAATDSSKPVTYTDFDGMKRVRYISQGYAEQLDGHKRPCDKQTERMRPLVAVTNWNSSPSEINVHVLCPYMLLLQSSTRERRVACLKINTKVNTKVSANTTLINNPNTTLIKIFPSGVSTAAWNPEY